MDLFGRWLFPHQPARVQRRKLQLLIAAIVLAVLACAVVAGLLIMGNHISKG
jgi:hypothetical protein